MQQQETDRHTDRASCNLETTAAMTNDTIDIRQCRDKTHPVFCCTESRSRLVSKSATNTQVKSQGLHHTTPHHTRCTILSLVGTRHGECEYVLEEVMVGVVKHPAQTFASCSAKGPLPNRILPHPKDCPLRVQPTTSVHQAHHSPNLMHPASSLRGMPGSGRLMQRLLSFIKACIFHSDSLSKTMHSTIPVSGQQKCMCQLKGKAKKGPACRAKLSSKAKQQQTAMLQTDSRTRALFFYGFSSLPGQIAHTVLECRYERKKETKRNETIRNERNETKRNERETPKANHNKDKAMQ